MYVKLLVCVFLGAASSTFTFRNVMVTCDSDDELPFGTIVTTNRLKPHLPNDQKCQKISIQYATIPVLYRESLSDIDNVDYVLLENDNIEEIEPGAFRNLEVKEALSLKSNKVREIRRGVFNDVQVPFLFLSYNFISYIDYQAFDNMTRLESVHLDHNKLSRIDSFWFRNTPKLNKLNLQYNLIEQVPRFAFQNLAAPSIDMSHNLISEVNPYALGGLKKLHFLSLAYNRIGSLDKNWIKGVKVNSLDISYNRLRCLSGGLAEPYSINYIDMNPWGCGCLEELKTHECSDFGRLVANESLRRCNLPLSNSNCM